MTPISLDPSEPVRRPPAGLALGLALGAVGAIAVGSAAPALKLLAVTALSPVNAIQARTVVGAVALLAVALVLRRGRMAVRRADWWLVAVYGVLTLAVNQVVYTVALARLPVGVALLLEYLAPVLVALWVRFARREHVPRLLWAGIVVLLAGLALVTQVWTAAAPDSLGVLFGLLAAVTLAARFVLAERGLRTYDPLVMATWGASLGAVALVAAGVVAPFPWHALTAVSTVGSIGAPVWALVLYVGLVGMAAAILLGAVAQRRIPSTSASLVAAVEIVVGGVLAAVLLGEHLDNAQWAGCAAMLAGIVLAQVAVARRSAAPSGSRALTAGFPPRPGGASGRRAAG
ncbi:DMT family transporter [Actinokineospora auranticolor]|uniref:Threonine/homoserine efflux transporter RhtA n=1 Tax=Actinokineospora auranticolor TaxID=155976 RepID=A0A2S6GER8_9PSEU|nr:DMT family transporter [Actinokineospora auranticolor]PPK63712.1 threonine/homoserine efflux transporter RhtA [Actinokineospora auranticolor]